jgi:hypothetical protein
VLQQRNEEHSAVGSIVAASAAPNDQDSDDSQEKARDSSNIEHSKKQEFGAYTKIDVKAQTHVVARLDFTAKNKQLVEREHDRNLQQY